MQIRDVEDSTHCVTATIKVERSSWAAALYRMAYLGRCGKRFQIVAVAPTLAGHLTNPALAPGGRGGRRLVIVTSLEDESPCATYDVASVEAGKSRPIK